MNKQEHNAYCANKYKTDPDYRAKVKERNKARKKEGTEFLYEAKLNSSCAICGYNRCPSALQFHHVDPSVKEFGVATMRAHSLKKIQAEIDKCIVLCANCHAEYHAGLIEL